MSAAACIEASGWPHTLLASVSENAWDSCEPSGCTGQFFVGHRDYFRPRVSGMTGVERRSGIIFDHELCEFSGLLTA